jgi:protein-tyrosine phosphatase
MIDWHSHILPAMDDGSKDVGESLAMLDVLKSQGVKTVIATPHFHANEETVDEFLSRRQSSYDMLLEAMADRDIDILCGAEIKYYPGIGRMEDLKKLSIGDTRLILLEMPMAKWTDYTLQELFELSNTSGLKIVMAHIERYLGMQGRQILKQLCESGIKMQVNASFFSRITSRSKAMNLLQMGYIHFIGSDCHNMTVRPPNIDLAYNVIQRKFGEDFVFQMIEYGNNTLVKQ